MLWLIALAHALTYATDPPAADLLPVLPRPFITIEVDWAGGAYVGGNPKPYPLTATSPELLATLRASAEGENRRVRLVADRAAACGDVFRAVAAADAAGLYQIDLGGSTTGGRGVSVEAMPATGLVARVAMDGVHLGAASDPWAAAAPLDGIDAAFASLHPAVVPGVVVSAEEGVPWSDVYQVAVALSRRGLRVGLAGLDGTVR